MTTIPLSTIDGIARSLRDEVIGLRRDFHAHPELGFEERRTSSVIAGHLAGLGLEVKTGLAVTGVAGLLKGDLPGRTVMLRADMDALPVQELNETEYRSTVPGVMHACGHDGHMAILLGAAKLFSSLRSSLRGRIMFVFQPAEENLGGARVMIKEGLLDDVKPDAAFGLHLISLLPYGYVGTRRGPFMASMDTFTIRIRGRGGHSAMSDGSVDAIALSAGVVNGLQAHVVNGLPEGSRILVNIGTIRGGTAHNIVADLVELEGTVRCLDEEAHSSIRILMEGFLRDHILPKGGDFELVYEEGYPTTANDPSMTDLVFRAAGGVVGAGNAIDLPPSMASEDMSFFLQKVPGCYFFVGAGVDDAAVNTPHHNPRFDIDERALDIGLKVLCAVTADFLGAP